MLKNTKWLAAGLGLLISGVFLWFAFRNLKPEQVIGTIQHINPFWLIIAAAVYFVGVTLISLRWQFLLRSIQYVPLRSLVPLVTIGYMGNNVYPFRSGELLRAVLLQRNHHVPIVKIMATVVVERVFDGLVMLTFILLSLLFERTVSPEVKTVAKIAAPIFITALLVFFVLSARPNTLRNLLHQFGRFVPGKLHSFLTRVADDVTSGLAALRSPAYLAGTVACSFASWMVEASVYWMVSFAFNLGVGYPVMLLVVGVVNLAGLIPASPGQIGVFEFFVSLVLVGAGVAEAQAKAYALVVHVVIWLPVTLVGFFFLARQGMGWGAITHARELETEVVSS
jgi:uncharacterized protein (TIRG00374 family)